MDIMKILAELYLQQQGIKALVETEPKGEKEREKSDVNIDDMI